MTLYKRGSIWWVKYQVDRVLHRQSCHTRIRKEAERFVQAITVARKAPTFEEAVDVLRIMFRQEAVPGMPLSIAYDRYLSLAAAVGRDHVTDRTAQSRRQAFRAFCDWLKHNAATVRTVEAVSGTIAARYAAALTAKGLKAQTRRNHLGNLSTVWKMLEKESPRISNPWLNLSPRNDDGERGKAFTPEDERRVMEAARKVGKDWPGVCMLMRHTGLRYSDVARLTWGETAGGVIRIAPHKTARYRIGVAIPLTREAAAALDEVRKGRDETPADAPIFPAHDDTWRNHGAAKYHALNFREVLRAAGLDGVGYTIHSWRHTAATRLAESGADVETRKRILGHRVDATAERYDHAEHLAETRKALEGAAAGACGRKRSRT